jgi:flap endonuclease-1
MGIKRLKHLIRKYAPNSIIERDLSHYANKIIAIDVSIYLYKFAYISGDPIELLMKQILKLRKNNIIPLYVFDGKPPKEKQGVLDERKTRKEDLKEKCDILMNMNDQSSLDELDRLKKQMITITYKNVMESKELMRIMGVSFLVANGEAETYCAELCKRGIVYGCLSEDTDILANGGLLFIQNFNTYNNKVVEYDFKKVLEQFGMDYDQFIDVCILCGCDYTSTITNIGIERAYKYIKTFKSIDRLIEYIRESNNNRYAIPVEFDHISARKLLKNEVDNNVYCDLEEIGIVGECCVSQLENFKKMKGIK